MDSSTETASRNAAQSHEPYSIESALKAHAARLGFRACGITSADDLDCGPTLQQWLEEGRHGHMDYLAQEPRKRLSPAARIEGARSVVVVAWPYDLAPPPDPRWRERMTGRIAAYAGGGDYHEHIAAKLDRLASFLHEATGAESAIHVDAGPLVEKDLARRAGLGWYGRNTNLLMQGSGSSFLLGCLVTTARLVADAPFAADHCGTCRACVPACPTGALDDGPTIDARLCISYLTIELKGPMPRRLRGRVSNWIFGCDACQETCPWTPAAGVAASFHQPYLPGLLAIGADEFRDVYGRTAVMRTRRRGLARNAAVALGNTGNPAAAPPLARALAEHDEPLVRAHCAWALGAIGGAEAAFALERSRKRESVPPVLAEIDAARVEINRSKRSGADP
ncbi:MAG TPA: tRNA epoxyqueuosine(34) reductase QueG [Candidatus Binatia bacterium]|nr:tRNA epoxyqueuosine(34) reductase QueG [Candidatus Binatia bacterium]